MMQIVYHSLFMVEGRLHCIVVEVSLMPAAGSRFACRLDSIVEPGSGLASIPAVQFKHGHTEVICGRVFFERHHIQKMVDELL